MRTADGRIYAGVEGGRIFRLRPDGKRPGVGLTASADGVNFD